MSPTFSSGGLPPDRTNLGCTHPEDAESLAVQREAIECGYEYVYDINSPIDSDTMNEDDCREVWDTLDMFRAIDHSISELKTNAFKNHRHCKFCGYDGNNETKFMAFTSYTVERLERWEELSSGNSGNFNSHSEKRPIYKKMLAVWKNFPVEERFSMTQEQLQAVLDAARPSRA